MSIIVKEVGFEEYKKYQSNFETENFIQYAQYFQVQKNRKKYSDINLILFYEGDKVVGTSIVVFRKKFRFFKEAMILHGPVLNYSENNLEEILVALTKFVKTKKAHTLLITPYLENDIFDEELRPIKLNAAKGFVEIATKLGYKKVELSLDQAGSESTIFRKDISQYQTEKDLLNSINKNVVRNIKKYEKRGVKLRKSDDIDLMYSLLFQSSQRKNHSLQNKEFFYNLSNMENSQNYIAYLDFKEYETFLNNTIDDIKKEIEKLKLKDTQKNENKISNLLKDLEGYEEKLEESKILKVDNGEVILSGLIFMESDHEIVYFLGGNVSEYFQFNGSSVAMWELMKEAYHKGKKYFNFFGVVEIEKTNENTGNFNFKKKWGGELVKLVGSYRKNFSIIFSLINLIKK